MATEAGPAAQRPAAASDLDLLDVARRSLPFAHAPYSQFRVGAAVVDEQGRVYCGANVENVSYGLTICAERSAIFTAIGAGAKRIRTIAVVAEKQRPVMPCGACRQVMAEFCAADARIVAEDRSGAPLVWSMAELLPFAFDSDVEPDPDRAGLARRID